MSIILAIFSGIGLGYVIERGDLCFHSTLRGLVKVPRELDLFRAYLLALLIATPVVTGLRTLGWIDPWIPPFAWPANIAGGVIFGVGMVVAASCITGLFYKLGHGMLGTLVALVAWVIGDVITYRGPLASFREMLNGPQISVNGQSATVLNLLGTLMLVAPEAPDYDDGPGCLTSWVRQGDDVIDDVYGLLFVLQLPLGVVVLALGGI